MPRPKGSKNKVKPTTTQLDFTSLIAEKSSSKEALVADIAALVFSAVLTPAYIVSQEAFVSQVYCRNICDKTRKNFSVLHKL